MAYTKTPEQSTHNIFRIPPTGNQTATSHTKDASAEAGLRYVNCYPTIRESKTKEPKVYLQKAPRILTKTWVFPDNNAGITDYDFETNLFIHNTRIYKVIPTDPSGPEIRLLNDTESYRLLSCQKIIDYTLTGDTIVTGICQDADGNQYSYTYNETTDTFEYSADPIGNIVGLYVDDDYVEDDYFVGAEGEQAVVRDLVVDGYHVIALKAIKGGTNRVLLSNPGQPNLFYPDTDYFTPEIDPDNIVDIQYHKNFIVVIGTHTIEFYYNAGNEFGSAFSRQDNYTIRLGAQQNMFANNGLVSIAYGDDIYLLANSENGGNAIYVIRDFRPIKISDDYIDYLLNDSTGITADIPTNTIRLGVVDVMGVVMFAFELKHPTNYQTKTFLFNERDMSWWEWKEYNGGVFYPATYGPTSNLNGHPFILNSGELGVTGNVQYTIAKVETNLIEVAEIITCLSEVLETGETVTLLAAFDAPLVEGETMGSFVDDNTIDPTGFLIPSVSDQPSWRAGPWHERGYVIPYAIDTERPVIYWNLPQQASGWLNNGTTTIQDANILTDGLWGPTYWGTPYSTFDGGTTISANKIQFKVSMPTTQINYYPNETEGVWTEFFENTYAVSVQGEAEHTGVYGNIVFFQLDFFKPPTTTITLNGNVYPKPAASNLFESCRPTLTMTIETDIGDLILTYYLDNLPEPDPVFNVTDIMLYIYFLKSGQNYEWKVNYLIVGEETIQTALRVTGEFPFTVVGDNSTQNWGRISVKPFNYLQVGG